MKATATLIVGGVAVAIALLGHSGGSGQRPLDREGVRIVGARPTAMPERLTRPSQPMSVSTTDMGAQTRSAGEERNWDDAGSALDSLSSELRIEQRDEAWAFRSEARLRAHLSWISHGDVRLVQVRCARTLCEISGVAPPSTDKDDLAAMLQSLQDAGMRSAMPDATLVGGPALVGGNYDVRYRVFFRRVTL